MSLPAMLRKAEAIPVHNKMFRSIQFVVYETDSISDTGDVLFSKTEVVSNSSDYPRHYRRKPIGTIRGRHEIQAKQHWRGNRRSRYHRFCSINTLFAVLAYQLPASRSPHPCLAACEVSIVPGTALCSLCIFYGDVLLLRNWFQFRLSIVC